MAIEIAFLDGGSVQSGEHKAQVVPLGTGREAFLRLSGAMKPQSLNHAIG